MQKRILIIILSMSFFFTACQTGVLYEKYHNISKNKWHKDSTLTFSVDVTDTVNSYNFFINLRHTNEYPYRNIIFFVEVVSPAGDVLSDTAGFMLADKKGKWQGKGLGRIYTEELKYKENIRFPLKGVYQVKLLQGMRNDLLPHIRNVGVRIERFQ